MFYKSKRFSFKIKQKRKHNNPAKISSNSIKLKPPAIFTLLNRIRPSSEKIPKGSLGPLLSNGHRPQAPLGAAIQIRWAKHKGCRGSEVGDWFDHNESTPLWVIIICELYYSYYLWVFSFCVFRKHYFRNILQKNWQMISYVLVKKFQLKPNIQIALSGLERENARPQFRWVGC